jgi:hypothetical protein
MKTRNKEKWYNTSVTMGWSKHDPAHLRRYRAARAHKGNKLAAGRALQALANVTTDKTTRKLARADAVYFFDLYKKERR